jgi:hypothetical protein
MPPLAFNISHLTSEERAAPHMMYSTAKHTKSQLLMTRSLSESCLEGMSKGGTMPVSSAIDLDSEPCRGSLEKPFAKTLQSPTDNLRRCVSLPPSSYLWMEQVVDVASKLMMIQEHSKQSRSSSTSTILVQQRKNTAEATNSLSILDESSDDATSFSSSFADSSSQGYPSSVDTDFDIISSDNDDDYNFYLETDAQEEEHQHEHYDFLMEQARYQQDLAAVSAPVPFIFERIKSKPHQQQHSIQSLIANEDWTELKTLVERDPDVCRQRVHMIFQCENITCLPLHAVVGRRGAGILSAVDCLVTTYPGSLMRKEEGGDRLPLHMAILKGASLAVIRYLLEALPQALEKADCEGNLPLHYAAMYSSEQIIRLVADRYPAACRHANVKERMPLHLLCARNWDHQDYDLISLNQIHCIFTSWPAAVQHADRNGCLPLHVACSQPQPRWDVLNLLIEAFAAGLLHKDDEERVPLQICRRIASSVLATSSPTTSTSPFCRDNDVVLAYLRDKTNQEKRKHLRERIFTIRIKRG